MRHTYTYIYIYIQHIIQILADLKIKLVQRKMILNENYVGDSTITYSITYKSNHYRMWVEVYTLEKVHKYYTAYCSEIYKSRRLSVNS